jgi:PAS domain S-box-containing protein
MKDSKEISRLIAEFQKRDSALELDNALLKETIDILRIAEEKTAVLNSIVESSDDAIISKDLNGIITSWNTAAQRIFGYSPAEIIGQSILKLIPDDRKHEETHILNQLRKGIQVDHFETRRKRKDGSLVDLSLTISPILSGDGSIIGLSKIARDLTANRKAEVVSERLSAIIDCSDDAIISKDLNSIVTSWNDSAERIFGYTAAEMIGESILKIIPTNRLSEEPRILSQLKQGNRVDHFETVRMKKDGTLIYVSLTISPIKDRNGDIVGLSKIARDITENKLMEKKKDEFIGFVSHELKTPLTSLRSYVQIALHQARKQELDFIANALSRADIQTKKMEKMISDFLNISRFEEGKMQLELSRFDIVSLIKNCVEDASIVSTRHLISYDGITECFVYGDQEKLSLVMTNLLGNAQKYSPEQGNITVCCHNKGNNILISVKDEGIGISTADQKRLFQKFFRVSNEQTRFISGFGIGLYLVSMILELHGSTISVESCQGSGATFLFQLPLEG